MDTDGYVVFRQWVDVPAHTQKRFRMLAETSHAIFNSAKGNDARRRQVAVRKNGTVWMKQVCEKLPLEGRQVGSCVVLLSLPGCEAQAPHCDYVPDAALLACSAATVPCGFLLALQDRTSLDVWPGSHRVVRGEIKRTAAHTRRTRLFLSKGDAVMFRGDLIHAGCPYASRNLRLHFYLDHESCYRVKDQTWLAPTSWHLK